MFSFSFFGVTADKGVIKRKTGEGMYQQNKICFPTMYYRLIKRFDTLHYFIHYHPILGFVVKPDHQTLENSSPRCRLMNVTLFLMTLIMIVNR
jgi:hypothetical protein